MTEAVFDLHVGTAPLLISMPHHGSAVPAALRARLTDAAQRTPDTDWHVSRLYSFAQTLGASVLRPHWSRYVVDLNRPPDDVSLYPGQNTTGLCPTVTFAGTPVYRPGQEPSAGEIAERVQQYWQPYHQALVAELERLRAQHGQVLLWEAHSIRSVVPFLFDGRLPDLNIGTAGGNSCRADVRARLSAALAQETGYTHAVDGRFKGGYITRHYGRPAQGVDAVQLELAQCNYMDEETFTYDEGKAARLAPAIERLIRAASGHG
jgi:N-formylglutamate deformylase